MPAPRFPSLLIALALGSGGPVWADGVAGPYLAGRVASIQSDYAAAATYFNQSLTADPGNQDIQVNAILAEMGLGEFEKAEAIARTFEAEGGKGGLSDLAVLAVLAHTADFSAILADMDKGRSAGPLVDGFLRAWAQLGNGQMSEAGAEFDALAKKREVASFALFHKALALASVGDFEGADAILSGKASGPINATRRSVIAHAQILSQLERNKDAVELITKTMGAAPADPYIAGLMTDLDAGKVLPFDLVRSPADGIAEVFLAVGSALSNDMAPNDTGASVDVLLFARTAHYLRPDLSDAALLTAGTLERQGQHELAIEAYGLVAPESPDHLEAELGRADALISTDRMDAAIEVLQQLAKSLPERVQVWAALGDTLRRNERFEESIVAYDKALALVKEPQPQHWALYYARAICFERLKDWGRAEPDFLKALTLSPDQPQVLNYLGYSYLEMNQNLDEALSMIDRAAKAQPENGAISDSLGWAYYRLGRYPEAEAEMERAVRLEPVDPVVTDHLGDVYWAVGRKREAEFQWKRALSFKPEEEEANRIRRKLEVGLDAVLKEEGAEPLAVTTNGG
ncbi:MAG TPA: tetratricopeptide repeat protein [Paracoccaceae bacterium]|nr:tetratricopeptide repeat protein [Paracoccaceae bacterium]